MSLFQPPAFLDQYLSMPIVNIAIYLSSSFYNQLIASDVFNKLRPYSYFLSPLYATISSNLMLLYFGQIGNSLDTKIYVLLSHFLIGFIILNANMNSKSFRLLSGISVIFFNTTGILIYYSKGFNQYGIVGAFIFSYLACVLISYVYLYIVVYFWQKHTIKIYANPKTLLQNTITFSIIFVIVAILHNAQFPHIYLITLGFYTLIYLDDNLWHKLPEFYSKAKLD
ncbi:hypothetical protein ENUP19_0046G0033 [Entamoeba nuttalli]|uniref:Uncharacterized protein n=2 Tax=Entamoeba nuttalli TaxID=412467 RepID=K2H5T9_ENTNP|nr:hypothetical protein ENU1_002640 [Entamoeba nuttalli P19]EKE42978.1 hypothetical protein ENU1_002640 [Entamoeba nuttalli P19]|eukprot:XP_008854685.1 hypothetical protein ENU1_002640 [Entamoeba nuttalli P19]